jgi:hypothetical protein
VKDSRLDSEIDFYIPINLKILTTMLEPLELAVEKGCYQSKKGRAIATLVAEKMIKEGKPVMVRYLKKI